MKPKRKCLMSTEMEEALEKHETKEDFSKSSFGTFMLPPIIVLLFGLGCLIVDGKFIWWAFAPVGERAK